VGGVFRVAAGIARRRAVDAGQLPEAPLGAPEAAQAEDRPSHALRPGALQRIPVDVVTLGHAHPLWPALQGLLPAHHLILATKKHELPPLSATHGCRASIPAIRILAGGGLIARPGASPGGGSP